MFLTFDELKKCALHSWNEFVRLKCVILGGKSAQFLFPLWKMKRAVRSCHTFIFFFYFFGFVLTLFLTNILFDRNLVVWSQIQSKNPFFFSSKEIEINVRQVLILPKMSHSTIQPTIKLKTTIRNQVVSFNFEHFIVHLKLNNNWEHFFLISTNQTIYWKLHYYFNYRSLFSMVYTIVRIFEVSFLETSTFSRFSVPRKCDR